MESWWSWALIIAGALMVLIELALGGFAGFDLVLIGTSFLLGGAIGLFTHSGSVGTAATAAFCVIYIALGRRYVRARLHRPGLPTNTDALLGLRGRVTAPISEHEPGQVRVRDEVWRARPAPGQAGTFEAGSEVIVEGVDGVTLLVRR